MASTDNSGDAISLVPSQVSGNSGNRNRRRRKGGKKKHENGGDDGQPGAKEQGGGTDSSLAPSNAPVKPAPNSSNAKNNKPKGKRNRNRKDPNRKRYPWRKHLPPGSRDPITIESLASIEYPPFALAASEPYVPVPEWPVPEPSNDESQHAAKDEKLSPDEWQRQVIQEQWGDAAADILPPQENQADSQEEQNEIPPEKRHYNLFDGRALAYYLVSQLQFIDPFNRRDLTRDELVNLDAYLVRHGFNDLKVTEAYDAKGVTLSTAGAAGNTAEGRAAILQQEANVVLHSIVFGSSELQRQYAASQRRQERSTSNRRARRDETPQDSGIYGADDGGFLVIDDDENPGLRGRQVRPIVVGEDPGIPMEISMTPNTLWSSNRTTENLSHSARTRELNFPSLPTPTTTDASNASSQAEQAVAAKGPSKSLQRISKVVKPTDPAQVKRQKEAREEAQRRAMMANLNYMAPGSTDMRGDSNTAASGLIPVPSASSLAPTSGQILRNQAMASALGVKPATVRQISSGWARPVDGKLELDEFGNELNAAQYPDSLLEQTQGRMDTILKLERKWKAFLADDKSASLPLRPMDRELRTFVHHYSDFWNLHTESFDREPKRYINCVKLRETRVPVPLLSKVARKWRGPTAVPVALPRGSREITINEETSRQAAGQTTASREFPPAPQREPLKLKPRSVPIPTEGESGEQEEATRNTEGVASDSNSGQDSQLNSRFDSLFTGRERPKLELAARTVPLELPAYQPAKPYDVMAERERQKAVAAEKARKEREAAEQKAKILAYAFASSDEESAGDSSDWEEQEQEYSGSDDEQSK